MVDTVGHYNSTTKCKMSHFLVCILKLPLGSSQRKNPQYFARWELTQWVHEITKEQVLASSSVCFEGHCYFGGLGGWNSCSKSPCTLVSPSSQMQAQGQVIPMQTYL